MKNYMVFDIGGSMVKYAVINEDGNFIDKGEYPSAQHDFNKFKTDMVKITIENKEKYQVCGIALSCPGGVNSDTGIIGGSSALPCIHGPNFKEILLAETGLTLELENDANCAALGEVWKGAAKDNNNVLFVVIGSGIGGAVIKDRKIHKGNHLHGGEIGYMLLNVKNQNGKTYFKTWSELAATGSLVSQVARMKGIDPVNLNGKKIFDAAEAGDKECIQAIDCFYLTLAQGIFNIQYVYDPEKIILGGAISTRKDLTNQIDKKLDIIMDSVEIAKVRPNIQSSHFKNDANLLGALFHYLQRQHLLKVKNSA
ncbi:ROK family protein (plasmid) [Priestia megaterium]|uniref:ROK family protein n=1 Tax=Priestia megaterium TaxID=1404 RepID=UPI002ACDBC93|nr:ROK family protein [Priestia megaterium]